MFRRDVLNEVGLYDEKLIFPEYDLLIKIMEKYKGEHISKDYYNNYGIHFFAFLALTD